MSYTVDVIDLLQGKNSSPSSAGLDGRILSVSTDSKTIRDIVTRATGVATWETFEELDHTWIIYLAPVHGMTVLALRDCVEQQLAQAHVQAR